MTRKPIDPGLSIYFDFVRIVAAVIVVLHHVWPLIVPAVPIPWPGHEAVVVFFVLSGYVIAYSTSDPTMRLRTYVEHRAARILSVALPALLLAAAIAPFAAGPTIQYAGPLHMSAEQFWFASLVNAAFLGQSLGLNVSAPFNAPFWSLCYEVWYYVVFATWMYSSNRWRIVLTVLALAIAGLKIIVLLPVWLLGVALFHRMPRMTQRQAVQVFAASSALAFAFYWSGASHILRAAFRSAAPAFSAGLGPSNQFIGDLIMGVFVAANFAAVASLGSHLRVMHKLEKHIRYASSYTLSTYLYHMPLTVLIWNGLGVRNAIGFLVLLAVFIVALGMFTERRLKFFRALIAQAVAIPLWLRS